MKTLKRSPEHHDVIDLKGICPSTSGPEEIISIYCGTLRAESHDIQEQDKSRGDYFALERVRTTSGNTE